MSREDLLETYDFVLPEELIAQSPADPRDESRLLVLHRRDQRWEHRRFRDIPEYLDSNDVLVVNNTKVIRARLLGQRLLEVNGRSEEGGRIEFVMLERRDDLGARAWEGLFHASAKYVAGLRFRVPTPDGKGLEGELIRGSADSPTGTVVARFDRDPIESGAGEMPLPKYIKRAAGGPQAEDEHSYQTVYASNLGSAAAPTAGLHFTNRVIADVRARGVGWEELTLHVGLGTFRPVKDLDLSAHKMHEERFMIDEKVATRISNAKRSGKKILAVGTTSVRTLESAWDSAAKSLKAGSGRTSIFIRPGVHQFQVVDKMLTNFHLPRSTLLMLISAFAGTEFVLDAYKEAVRQKYRFFSYGDSMLIL
jgi:S-adenosylmethionine:tRNA ribosyltransferase-isomerase